VSGQGGKDTNHARRGKKIQPGHLRPSHEIEERSSTQSSHNTGKRKKGKYIRSGIARGTEDWTRLNEAGAEAKTGKKRGGQDRAGRWSILATINWLSEGKRTRTYEITGGGEERTSNPCRMVKSPLEKTKPPSRREVIPSKNIHIKERNLRNRRRIGMEPQRTAARINLEKQDQE